MSELLNYFAGFVLALREQLEKDDVRWGDTWQHRPIAGQEDRAYERYRDYFDQFKHGGTPIPWLKVAGEAFICWVREQRQG